MNLGIDIGSTKTVIFSTKDNGTVVEDEFGKKEIRTVIERTSPIRSFGNSVSGDSIECIKLRKRHFLNKILESENQENLLMFLNYLDRTIKLGGDYRAACLTIPENFTEEEKRILKNVVEESNLKVTSFMTHLTGVASCAALRNLQISSPFMIIDCGYSKTSVGTFIFAENKLTPINRWTLHRGAADFDDAIFSVLSKKYNLPDNIVYRERIFKEINTIKKGLGEIESVGVKIFSETYDVLNMKITRDEYLEALVPTLKEFTEFLEKVKEESQFKGYIEVVGNNSNNAFIRDILNSLSYMTTLNTSESAALGSCLALAVTTRNMQFKIEEILGFNISVKIEEENGKMTLVFPSNSPVTTDAKKIKYSRRGSFSVEVLENEKKIGVIRVNKKETEEPETVVIRMAVTPFLTIDVLTVEGGTDCTFTFECFGLSKERIEEIKKIDEEFSKRENEKKEMERHRNYLENLLDSIDSSIDRVFPKLLTNEDRARIDQIRNDFFDSQPDIKSVEDELNLRQEYIAMFGFITTKLKAIEDTVRAEADAILKKFENETSKHLSFKSTSASLLSTQIYRLRGFLSGLHIGIENVSSYDSSVFEKLKEGIAIQTELARIEEEKASKDQSCDGERCDDKCCCDDQNCTDTNDASKQ